MSATYSTYEAKAKLSEILRLVQEGQHVIITRHGEPVAEVRPIGKKKQTLEERMLELERRGCVTPPEDPWAPLPEGVSVPGALARFLADRDDG